LLLRNQIPQGKGKAAVEYTLVAAPLSQLDGNATAPAAAPAAANASAASTSNFVCSLASIKVALIEHIDLLLPHLIRVQILYLNCMASRKTLGISCFETQFL
jgi:hypothetical protein